MLPGLTGRVRAGACGSPRASVVIGRKSGLSSCRLDADGCPLSPGMTRAGDECGGVAFLRMGLWLLAGGDCLAEGGSGVKRCSGGGKKDRIVLFVSMDGIVRRKVDRA